MLMAEQQSGLLIIKLKDKWGLKELGLEQP